MNDSPLAADPNEAPPIGSAPAASIDLAVAASHANGVRTSVVDTVFDLDEFLAADIRLAEKQAAFYTRPDLEAQIEELNAELDSLTDANGRPLPDPDRSLEEGRTAQVVMVELAAVQKEYAASRRSILMRQLDTDDWDAFQTQWKEEIAKEPPAPRDPAFYADLISRCAIKPEIPADKIAPMRKRIGAPAFEEIWRAAWNVNTRSGVSIPKSWLSSAVQRQLPQG